MPPADTRQSASFAPPRTLRLGHRGASAHAPENTLFAFRRALDLGADGIECDIQRTADGELVLIHDGTVDRTTNGTGIVGEMTYAALAALDAGGEGIPRLDQLLTFAMGCIKYGRTPFLNLELKMPGTGPDTLAALQRAVLLGRQNQEERDRTNTDIPVPLWPIGYPGPLAISSFDYPSLEETRRLDSAVELWILSGPYHDDLLAQARAINATCLDLHHRAITPEVVARVTEAGLGLVAWTANEPADIARLLALDPPLRAIIGDYPERLVAE
ncbi:MAG TPA: glycerophosphodiester phosphodiesterase family protein [Thermomicrobiales bacterium]|jgi:glycerophosphoryl diester phosphodiesterase